MYECQTFQDFQNIFKTTKLHVVGIDDVPLTEDKIAQMWKNLWLKMMNDDNCQDSIILFQEHMTSLEQNKRGLAITSL